MTTAVIQTHGPDASVSWHGQDALLSLASLDLNPQLILINEAVYHVLRGADVQRHQRSLQKRYRLLELYDCPTPWVLAADLQRYGLVVDDLVMAVEVLDTETLQQRLSDCHKVMRF